MVYLDDGLGAAAGQTNAKIASLQVQADLCRSGFLANDSKCVWEPTQVISWLGRDRYQYGHFANWRHRKTDPEFTG